MPELPHVDIELRVRYGETDQMGVVYHAEYLVWCEMGRTEYIRQLGTSYADLERSGTRLVVAEASLRYHAPARYDEILRVETTLSAVRSRALTFDYLICHAESGRRLVTARTLLVALDNDGKTVPLTSNVRRMLDRAPIPLRDVPAVIR
ncbi:MAG: thioesterase family protein [Gemmatimonadota bacterium]